MALLITLLVVTLMTIVVMEFTDSTQIEAHLTRHALSGVQADYLARAGVTLGTMALLLDATEKTKVPPLRPNVDSLIDPWALPFPPQDLGGVGGAGFRIDDESSRFNVNTLSGQEGTPGLEARKAVFQGILTSIGLDTNLLFPLLDWLDADDDVSNKSGAEQEYYLGLVPPYMPRNGRLLSVEELTLVRGFGNVSRAQWAILKSVVTVLPDDQLGINVNTASEAVIAGILSAVDASGSARAILQRRETQPFASLGELGEVPGWNEIPQEIRSFFDVHTRFFTIHGIGVAADVKRGVAALTQRDNVSIRVLQWRPEAAVSLTPPSGSGGITGLSRP